MAENIINKDLRTHADVFNDLYANAPSRTSYNVGVNADLANRVSQGLGSVPGIGPALSAVADFAMPAGAFALSPAYDTLQGISRAGSTYSNQGPYAGIVDDTQVPAGPTLGQIGQAIANEKIGQTMFERMVGASAPLANRISNFNAPNFNFMGTAQASDLTNLEKDFPGMSTGDIIDSMNARQRADRFSGMGQVGPNKSNMNAPAALDMDRFAGVSNLGRNDMDVEQVEQLGSPSRFQGFKNQISNFIDNPVTRGLGTAFNFARGSLPGMVMSGIGSLFSRNPNAPSYQSRTPGFDYNNLNESMINDFYDSNEDSDTFGTNRFDRAVPGSFGSFRTLAGYLNRDKAAAKAAMAKEKQARKMAEIQEISKAAARQQQQAIENERGTPGTSDYGNVGGTSGAMTDANAGTYCFDPSTPIQMADGSTKEIKEIQLGDNTKGGEVTGVFQFKATDEIHDYKGVTVAGSHYVKEDDKFIMVKDSPLAVKIDKIPVVYSLDTTGRRIFINDIEFADYNGDGVAKNFLSNAGVDLTGFDTEVLRQVEQRLI